MRGNILLLLLLLYKTPACCRPQQKQFSLPPIEVLT
jgi:hypothetical protein